MSQYKQYEIRRIILSFKSDEHTRALLVLLEHIDWSTGVKTATSFTHMKNWLNQLCDKYNVEEEAMKKVVQVSIRNGWLTLSENGCVLSLGIKPVPSLIDEVPAPVETVEVPAYQDRVPLTRENIRLLAECPKCGAEKGLMCVGEQKGKNNREANHKERSQAAARLAKVI